MYTFLLTFSKGDKTLRGNELHIGDTKKSIQWRVLPKGVEVFTKREKWAIFEIEIIF